MASAIISGLIKSNLFEADKITVCDRNESRRKFLDENYNVNTTKYHADAIKAAEINVLAIKP